MIRLPPASTRSYTLFPDTPLFRSPRACAQLPRYLRVGPAIHPSQPDPAFPSYPAPKAAAPPSRRRPTSNCLRSIDFFPWSDSPCPCCSFTLGAAASDKALPERSQGANAGWRLVMAREARRFADDTVSLRPWRAPASGLRTWLDRWSAGIG